MYLGFYHRNYISRPLTVSGLLGTTDTPVTKSNQIFLTLNNLTLPFTCFNIIEGMMTIDIEKNLGLDKAVHRNLKKKSWK
jgi:hypothetical protein